MSAALTSPSSSLALLSPPANTPQVVGNPALINETPEDAAWLIKVDLADKAELDDLLDADAYAEWCASRD